VRVLQSSTNQVIYEFSVTATFKFSEKLLQPPSSGIGVAVTKSQDFYLYWFCTVYSESCLWATTGYGHFTEWNGSDDYDENFVTIVYELQLAFSTDGRRNPSPDQALAVILNIQPYREDYLRNFINTISESTSPNFQQYVCCALKSKYFFVPRLIRLTHLHSSSVEQGNLCDN